MSGILGSILGEAGAGVSEAAAGEALGPAAANLGRAAGQSIGKAIAERRKRKQSCDDADQAFPTNSTAFPSCDDNGGRAFR